MASNSRRPRSDTQSYTPQGRNFQQYTRFSGSRVPSLSPYAIPDEHLNKSDPSYPSTRDAVDYSASSSSENGRRIGNEGYVMQAWQYPAMVEDQSWKSSLCYSGQQQRYDEHYLHPTEPIQSGSYPINFGDTHPLQQYSPSYASPSYLENNRMPSVASPSRSPYSPFMPVPRPSIVVDEVQDDHICNQRDAQSSYYQDYLGTNVLSASHRGASVRPNAQRSSTRTPNRNRRNHRTQNDMMDMSDLEECAEGKLSGPRASRGGQKEDDSQRRRRHLTRAQREHAKDVRKVRACEDCRRKKIMVCLVRSSGFALLLNLLKS